MLTASGVRVSESGSRGDRTSMLREQGRELKGLETRSEKRQEVAVTEESPPIWSTPR